jgi:hypothetical protein
VLEWWPWPTDSNDMNVPNYCCLAYDLRLRLVLDFNRCLSYSNGTADGRGSRRTAGPESAALESWRVGIETLANGPSCTHDDRAMTIVEGRHSACARLRERKASFRWDILISRSGVMSLKSLKPELVVG